MTHEQGKAGRTESSTEAQGHLGYFHTGANDVLQPPALMADVSESWSQCSETALNNAGSAAGRSIKGAIHRQFSGAEGDQDVGLKITAALG